VVAVSLKKQEPYGPYESLDALCSRLPNTVRK